MLGGDWRCTGEQTACKTPTVAAPSCSWAYLWKLEHSGGYTVSGAGDWNGDYTYKSGTQSITTVPVFENAGKYMYWLPGEPSGGSWAFDRDLDNAEPEKKADAASPDADRMKGPKYDWSAVEVGMTVAAKRCYPDIGYCGEQPSECDEQSGELININDADCDEDGTCVACNGDYPHGAAQRVCQGGGTCLFTGADDKVHMLLDGTYGVDATSVAEEACKDEDADSWVAGVWASPFQSYISPTNALDSAAKYASGVCSDKYFTKDKTGPYGLAKYDDDNKATEYIGNCGAWSTRPWTQTLDSSMRPRKRALWCRPRRPAPPALCSPAMLQQSATRARRSRRFRGSAASGGETTIRVTLNRLKAVTTSNCASARSSTRKTRCGARSTRLR
eukprot:SAG11_NODE_5673_length_1490_cov_1.160316_1_plen_388_part_00